MRFATFVISMGKEEKDCPPLPVVEWVSENHTVPVIRFLLNFNNYYLDKIGLQEQYKESRSCHFMGCNTFYMYFDDHSNMKNTI